jgi:hypothetical protein
VLLVILSAYTKRTEGYTLVQTLGTEVVAEGRDGALVWIRSTALLAANLAQLLSVSKNLLDVAM